MTAIVLIGLRAVGKTTVGRALAAATGREFVDADELLAEQVGEPAGDFLARVGEAEFRRVEEAILLPLLAAPGDRVVATGGGAVTIPAVRAALQPGAAEAPLFVVWLRAEREVALARLAADGARRPALTELDPAAEFDRLAAEREPYYALAARFVIDSSAAAPATVAAAIVQACHRRGGAG
ncbi:MAG: shikimate kinase [bacterium]|nr:shikimate kinase [bacterium]